MGGGANGTLTWVLALGVAVGCGGKTHDAGKPKRESDSTPVSPKTPLDEDMPLWSLDELRTEVEMLLEVRDQYTKRDGTSAPCAPADDAAARMVGLLAGGPVPGCEALGPDDGHNFDNWLEPDLAYDHPWWTEETWSGVRSCAAELQRRLGPQLDTDRVCAPTRVSATSDSRQLLKRLDQAKAMHRALVLAGRDLVVAGRRREAVELGLSAAAVGQALGRGRVTFIEAAFAEAWTGAVLEHLPVWLGKGEGLSPAELDALARRVESLLATEPKVVDVLEGEYLGLVLSTFWAIDQPNHPALEGRESMLGPDPDLAQLMGQPKGSATPAGVDVAFLWSAMASLSHQLQDVCALGPDHSCHERSLELLDTIRDQPLPTDLAGGFADLNRKQVYRLMQRVLLAAVPDLAERGRRLSVLRIQLEVLRVGCPSDDALASDAWRRWTTPEQADRVELGRLGNTVQITFPDMGEFDADRTMQIDCPD